MKKVKKSILLMMALLTMVACLCFGVGAVSDTIVDSGVCGAKGDNVTWVLYDDGEIVISGEGEMADYDYVEPLYSEYNVKSVIIEEGVTTVGEFAFYNCENLEKVKLPNSLKKIGDWAFYLCGLLSDVELNEGLKIIGEISFASCNIKSVNIPKSLTDLHSRAFEGCPIEKYVVDADNPYYCSDENGVMFNKDNTILVKYPAGRTETSYYIPDGMMYIDENAFADSVYLKKIVIPNSVKTIGEYAFSGCSNLDNVIIPEGVEKIKTFAFGWCSTLSDIVISNGVNFIERGVFYMCSSLKNVVIPDSVLTIGDSIFESCENLETIYIGAGVCSMSEEGFGFCNKLTSIEVSAENKDYSSVDGILYNKKQTRIITIPMAVNGEINIPANIRELSYELFYKCEKIDTIVIDENNKYFKSIDGIVYSKDGKSVIVCPQARSREIFVSEGTEIIESWAFYDCEELIDVVLPDTVVEIGEYAFAGCSKINFFKMPDSVKEIGKSIFLGCDMLRYAKLSNKLKTFDSTFDDCGALEIAVLPEGTTTIGERCFVFDYNLKSIYIPSSVNKIEDIALKCGLNGSFHIYFGGSEEQWNNIEIIGENKALEFAKMHYNCSSENLIISEGYCGDNLYYKLDILGNLTISGKGDMYSYYWEPTPWSEYPIFNIVLEEGITSLGSDAFSGAGISKFIAPNSLTRIEEICFQGCDYLEDIEISGNVVDIERDAFSGCGNLKSIKVDENNSKYYVENNCLITRDTKTLLRGCSNSIIPSDVAALSANAFSACSMKFVHIPDSVKSIGWEAFDYCYNLESVTIPDGITEIDVHCFSGCSKLEYVVIPSSVYYIDEGAFWGCDKLTTVYFKGTSEEWDLVEINHKNEQRVVVSFGGSYGDNGWEFSEIPVVNKNESIDNANVVFVCNCFAPTEREAKAPTCATSGWDAYMICTKCNLSTYKEIAASGHQYKVALTPSTCIEEGRVTYVCSVCDDTYSEVIKTKEHNFSDDVCKTCGFDRTEDCNCNCHKNGISGFLFKLINFFNKIFRINRECVCGVYHY